MSLTWWKAVLINWGKKSLIFLCVFAALAWIRFMNEDVAWKMSIAEDRAEDVWRAAWRENNPDAKKNDGDIFSPDFVAWFEYWYNRPPTAPPPRDINKYKKTWSPFEEPEFWARMEAKYGTVDGKKSSPPSTPVKLNTGSITPLSREKLRMHEELVRDLLN